MSPHSILGRIVLLPLRLIPREAVVPILRGRLRGKKWIAGSSNHGWWLGTYETRMRLLMERTIAEHSVVFDVGAHVFYTLLASVLVGPEGEYSRSSRWPTSGTCTNIWIESRDQRLGHRGRRREHPRSRSL